MPVMNEQLAVAGGTPVRDVKLKPWPEWPVADEAQWRTRVEPALREVFLSHVEGLPGPGAQAFGAKLAGYCGAKFGRMVSHGTDAIAAALAGALDLQAWEEGGEVILPNYTFIATASAPLDRRCTLAFVDIDPDTFTIDPAAIEQAIVPGKTRAIIPVHLAGHPANMRRIMEIARKHGLKVIEDCAQAHGAICDGRQVGSIGDAGAFSFQSSKNLCSGEGGAVTTNDQGIDDRVTAFMDVGRHPRGERWEYPRLGWNYRPSEYLAALLSLRLDDLEAQSQHRVRMAKILSDHLRQVPGITPPQWGSWCTRHAYHLYNMLYEPAHFGNKSRDEVVAALRAEGVPVVAGYTQTLSQSPALSRQRERFPETIRALPCPNAEHVCSRSMWLTQNVLLANESDMAEIAETMAKVRRLMSR